MAYITNDGARLIERAKTEGKSIVFGSVRMNTIYKSDPSSLVQKSDEWFGANHGSVVGCLSHVSVDDVSRVCDSKLAIQCNDNSEPWKSLGIYAHLNGEEGEVLFACESIQNGEYKDVTIVELPVTLAGVVEDFGIQGEGGSGGGGGGSADIHAGQDIVQDDGNGNLDIFGQGITPEAVLGLDGMYFNLNSSGYLESVCVEAGYAALAIATIGVIVRDEKGNMVANGRVSGVSMGTKTPLTFQSPIQLLKGYTITYQAILSEI